MHLCALLFEKKEKKNLKEIRKFRHFLLLTLNDLDNNKKNDTNKHTHAERDKRQWRGREGFFLSLFDCLISYFLFALVSAVIFPAVAVCPRLFFFNKKVHQRRSSNPTDPFVRPSVRSFSLRAPAVLFTHTHTHSRSRIVQMQMIKNKKLYLAV